MVFSQVPLRAWFATLALGCFGLVGFGLELQAMLHLAPCPLCIFQRLVYLLVGGVAVAGYLLPAGRIVWAVLVAGLAVLGMGVAAYQTWMQAFPELANECSYTDPNLIERLVDWLGMQYPPLFLATGFCTSKEWVFLDLSMANWSVLVFAGILGYAVFLLKRRA
ncbi:MAG: disulfide bond formation protein DsbB [Proteobacteria bacterium]|nr:disulfide bond formation protein DsbB [Pseudomonadota bacterium]